MSRDSIRILTASLGLVLLAFTAGNALGQPANDNFAHRKPISGRQAEVSVNLDGATSEPGEPYVPGLSTGQTAWWTWTAPGNGAVNLSISSTNCHPLVTVYTGKAITNLTLVSSNAATICYSSGGCGCYGRVRGQASFNVLAGQSYQIAIDSAEFIDASGNTSQYELTTNSYYGGNVELGLKFTPAPSNDNFAHRTKLSGSSVQILASNVGASAESQEPNPQGSSVWYSWTAPASGRVLITTNSWSPFFGYPLTPTPWPPVPPWENTGSGPGGSILITIIGPPPPPPPCGQEWDPGLPPFFPIFSVYTGTSLGSLAPVDSSNLPYSEFPNGIQFEAVKGQTYDISFDGFYGTSGTIPLSLTLLTSGANDAFNNRIALHGAFGIYWTIYNTPGDAIFATAKGLNDGATRQPNEPPAPPDSEGNTVWWSWTAPASTNVSISLAGSEYTFPVSVYTGGQVGALKLVAEGAGGTSFNATLGQTYQIAVSDAAGQTGLILLTVQMPLIEAPLLSTKKAGGKSLLTYSASPGQVLQFQSQVESYPWWTNLATATCHNSTVSFLAGPVPADYDSVDFGPYYRAVVLDYAGSSKGK